MLRVALLGAGRMGHLHARVIAGHDDARLAWVCDPIEDAAKALAGRYGARWSVDARDALDDGDVDAVVIASATSTHTDLLRDAVLAGKKVLCEKPIDLDLAKVDRCWTEIAPHAPFVMIGFNRRFDPTFREIREPRGGWRDRHPPDPARDQPRPIATARRVPRDLGWHVPRHDDP